MPTAFCPGEVRPVDGKFRQNVGTKWGQAGPKFEARQFAAEKAEEAERRGRRLRREKQGKHQVDWQQKTMVEAGQEYAKYGSGSYEQIHGIKPGSTLHAGTTYSKASSVKQKQKDDAFKAATVQAGMDRDYHEAMMRRGHNPGDRSDADLKSPMHPDQSQAQREWELKRRIQNTHRIHVSNQREAAAYIPNPSGSNQSTHVRNPHYKSAENLQEITDKLSQTKQQESQEEAAFRAHIAAKLAQKAAEMPACEEEKPCEAPEPIPSGLVQESPYPTGRPNKIPSPEAAVSPEVMEGPGLHSRYQDDDQLLDDYKIPRAGWGDGTINGGYPVPHDVPYGYDFGMRAGYHHPPAAMFHGHRRSYPQSYGYGYGFY